MDIDNKQQHDPDDDRSIGSNKRQKLDNGEIDITNIEKNKLPQLKEIATSLGIYIKSGTKKSDIIDFIKVVYERKQVCGILDGMLGKQEIDPNLKQEDNILVKQPNFIPSPKLVQGLASPNKQQPPQLFGNNNNNVGGYSLRPQSSISPTLPLSPNPVIEEILVKQEAEAEADSNINTLEKQKVVIEFTIKDGVDESEWLFWKVFRNKFIYKMVMSNMDKRLTPDYNSIISVDKMIKRDQISILRDKVISNQYLEFGTVYLIIFSIFKVIRNNDDQDRLFYQQLFKYYGHHIFDFIASKDSKGEVILDGSNNRELLVILMIDANCLPALQILIQQYQYKPIESNLKHAIDQGSTKFIQLILQYQPQLKESAKQLLSNNNQSIELIKSLNWLHNESLIDIKTATTSTNINIIHHYIQSNKHQINETISLKLFIIICKLLLLSPSTDNTNRKIDDIETFSNSLTKQELKLSLSDASFQIQHRKDNILKLLDYYYSVSNTGPKVEFYYLYFKCNGTDYGQDIGSQVKFNNDNPRLQNQFKQSLQFANFSLFTHCFKNKAEETISKINKIK